MKKIFFLGTILFLASIAKVNAQDNTTGNATAISNVTTNSNNGNTTTHVETTVNGDTKTYDFQGSGGVNVKVEANSNGEKSSSTVTTNGSVTITPAPTKDATKSAAVKLHTKITQKNLVQKILDFLKSLFK